jgi:hypothetical protein
MLRYLSSHSGFFKDYVSSEAHRASHRKQDVSRHHVDICYALFYPPDIQQRRTQSSTAGRTFVLEFFSTIILIILCTYFLEQFGSALVSSYNKVSISDIYGF